MNRCLIDEYLGKKFSINKTIKMIYYGEFFIDDYRNILAFASKGEECFSDIKNICLILGVTKKELFKILEKNHYSTWIEEEDDSLRFYHIGQAIDFKEKIVDKMFEQRKKKLIPFVIVAKLEG